MALFKTLEEIRRLLPINTTFKFERILPVIATVQEDVLVPYCGRELIGDLDAAFNANDSITSDDLPPIDQKLLKMIQEPLALISMVRFIPIGEVQFSNEGITTLADDGDRKAAEDRQIVRLRANLLSMGMNSLERLLSFLEKNSSAYPKHEEILDSRPKTILPNAVEFSKYYPIQDSHLTYRGLLSLITEKEENIIVPILGDRYQTIFTDASLTGSMKRLQNASKRALAYLCVADAIELNMAVELSAEGLRLNYTSQIGNVKFYSPPDEKTRLSILSAAKKKATDMIDIMQSIIHDLDGLGENTGTGIFDNQDSKIVKF